MQSRLFSSVCLFASLLLAHRVEAQATIDQYKTDINGHRVLEASFASKGPGQLSEVSQSVNGRRVPLEKSESKVLAEGPSGKTIETVIQRFDADGRLAETVKTVTQEERRADGSSTLKATIYRSDDNGRLRENERRTVETSRPGTTTSSEVVIDRTGLDGSFQTVEKRSVVTTTDGGKTQENESIYRRSNNGGFVEALRASKVEQKADGKLSTNLTRYEPDYSGRLQVASQEVSSTVKAPDGSETVEVNLYGFAYGSTRVEGSPLSLKEQQSIVRKPGPDGTQVETVSVRRPTLADGNKLGPQVILSERVCKGNCLPAKDPKPDPQADPKAPQNSPTP